MDQAGFTPHQFRVLAHLWSRGHGRCFPSIDTIATSCGIRRGTVCAALNALEKAGCVTRKKRKSKGIRFANEYLLTGLETPPKSKPGRFGHQLTGTDGTPPNRDVLDTGNDTSWNDPSLNDSSLKTKGTKETYFSQEKQVFPFSPILSKEEQLDNLSLPKRRKYPTEDEFDDHVENEELDQVVNGRPDLWHDLTSRKWHHWNDTKETWEPIINWKKYVEALDNTMREACGQ